MASSFLQIPLGLVATGDRLVVGLMMNEASLEDADEVVAEGTQGLVVGVAGRTQHVVAEREGRAPPLRPRSMVRTERLIATRRSGVR